KVIRFRIYHFKVFCAVQPLSSFVFQTGFLHFRGPVAIQRVANSVITAPGTNALQPPHFRLRFSPAHRRPGEGGQAPSLCLQFEPGEIYPGVERPARSAPVTMLASSASVPPQNTRDSLREGSTSPPIRRIRQELPLTLRRQAAPLLPQSPACSINVPV